MKKIKYILLVLLIILISGCKDNFGEDIAETYKKYFEYALGNYEVTTLVKTKQVSGQIGYIKYTSYMFNFKDKEEKDRSIELDNSISFNKTLINALKIYLTDDLKTQLQGHDKSRLDNVLFERITLVNNLTPLKKSIKLSDTKKGVKIKDLVIDNVKKNNLNIEYYIELESINPYINDEELKNILVDTYGFMLEKANEKKAKIIFNIYDSESNKIFEKNLKYINNEFVWE